MNVVNADFGASFLSVIAVKKCTDICDIYDSTDLHTRSLLAGLVLVLVAAGAVDVLSVLVSC